MNIDISKVEAWKVVPVSGLFLANQDSFRATIDVPFKPDLVVVKQLLAVSNDQPANIYHIKSNLVDDDFIACVYPSVTFGYDGNTPSAPPNNIDVMNGTTHLSLDIPLKISKQINGSFVFRRTQIDGSGIADPAPIAISMTMMFIKLVSGSSR